MVIGARIEPGIDHLSQLPETARIICHKRLNISDLRWRKKGPRIRVLAGFIVLFGVNYVSESTSIVSVLVAFGRGANLPYFGKLGNILPYSPHEQKRNPIQGFPEVSDISEGGKGAQSGLIEYEDSGNKWECPSSQLCLLLPGKKKIHWRMITDESMSGTVPEIGNTAPAAGFTSMYTLEPDVIGFTRNVI